MIEKLILLFFISLSLTIFSSSIAAESCTTATGKTIDDCVTIDIDGNIILSWIHATERATCTADQIDAGCVSDKPLPLSEISHVKAYFHDIKLNHWTEAIVQSEFTALKIKKPAGTYEVFMTTFDTGGRESVGSDKILKTITDIIEDIIQAPKYPSFIELITSTTVRIIITE